MSDMSTTNNVINYIFGSLKTVSPLFPFLSNRLTLVTWFGNANQMPGCGEETKGSILTQPRKKQQKHLGFDYPGDKLPTTRELIIICIYLALEYEESIGEPGQLP